MKKVKYVGVKSGTISYFLDFLKESEKQLHIAEADEKYANDETQDILHRLELYDDPYDRNAHLAYMLKLVRRKRREAKDEIEITSKIVEWSVNNAKAVNSLRELLGEVRKCERRHEQRYYENRTKLLDCWDTKEKPDGQ